MPNSIEVSLSFKPVMDGLTKFTTGIKSRLQEVEAFNQRINKGVTALNGVVASLGLAFGAAGLKKFVDDAREADKVQQQLIQTLQRTGQTGAAEALEAQASALEKTTNFSGEAITNVQRLLITFGLTAKQAEGMTASVLDFAASTNQSAESAAMLMGRTLKGEQDEIGRLGIKLDQTKGKVDALGSALTATFGGEAQSAVVDAGLRKTQVEFEDATKSFGRAIDDLTKPILSSLIPALQRLAEIATSTAEFIRPYAPMLGDMAAAVIPVVAGWLALKAVFSATMMPLNMLRSAFVALTGQTLVELNNSLAALTKRFGSTKIAAVLLKDSVTSLSGAMRSLAIAGSIGAAAFTGYQIGSFLNDLQAAGMSIKDWTALILLYIGDKVYGVFAELQTVWTRVKGTWDDFRLHVQATALEMAIAVAEAWNRLPIGNKIDTTPWHFSVARMETEIAGLDGTTAAALDAITKRRIQHLTEVSDLMSFIAKRGAEGQKPTPPTKAPAPNAGPSNQDLNEEHFGDQDKTAANERELAQKRALYELDTAILEAQADGNQALVDKLNREKEEYQALNELGNQAYDIVQNRLNVEDELQQKERDRTAQEQRYSERIAELERVRARISASRFLTDEEKQRKILPLLEEENRLIAARIALLEAELKTGVTDERKGQITTQLDTLRGSQATNAGDQESNRSLGVGDEINAQLTTFQSGLGTRASAIANLLTGPIKAGIGALRTQFQALLGDTDYWTQKLGNIAGPIMGALTGAISDMFQQWIAGRIKAMIVSMTSSQKEGAADTAAKAPGATLAAISSFGIAVVIGLAAIAAVLASGGFAEGGQVRGPGGPKSDSIITRLSNGEYVIPEERVRQYGVGFFDSIRAGDLGRQKGYSMGGLVKFRDAAMNYSGALRDVISDSSNSADASSRTYAETRSSTPTAREVLNSSQSSQGGFSGALFVMLGEDYLHSAMESSPGQKILLRTGKANRRAMGIPT